MIERLAVLEKQQDLSVKEQREKTTLIETVKRLSEFGDKAARSGHTEFRKFIVNGDKDDCWAISLFSSQIGNGLKNPESLNRLIDHLKTTANQAHEHPFIEENHIGNLVSILTLVRDKKMNFREVAYMFNHEKVYHSITTGIRQAIGFHAQTDKSLEEGPRAEFQAREFSGTKANADSFNFFCEKMGCSQISLEDNIPTYTGVKDKTSNNGFVIPLGSVIHYDLLVPKDLLN